MRKIITGIRKERERGEKRQGRSLPSFSHQPQVEGAVIFYVVDMGRLSILSWPETPFFP